MSDPALTPEQWAQYSRKIVLRPGPNPKQVYGEYGIDWSHKEVWLYDDSWQVPLIPEMRHAIATVCLYGQEYGFTWDDVDALRWMVREAWFQAEPIPGAYTEKGETYCATLKALTDRIAALLPPREPKP